MGSSLFLSFSSLVHFALISGWFTHLYFLIFLFNIYFYYYISNFQEIFFIPWMLLFLIWWLYILALRILSKEHLTFSSTCLVYLSCKLLFTIHFGLCISCERLSSCLINLACPFLFKKGAEKLSAGLNFRGSLTSDSTTSWVHCLTGEPPHSYL